MFANKKIVSVEREVCFNPYKWDPSGSEHSIISIELDDKTIIHFYHEQQCCESVTLESGFEEAKELEGQTLAFVKVSHKNDDANDDEIYINDWTFYDIVTDKGEAQLRFLGSSNGYYSTAVSIVYKDVDDSFLEFEFLKRQSEETDMKVVFNDREVTISKI